MSTKFTAFKILDMEQKLSEIKDAAKGLPLYLESVDIQVFTLKDETIIFRVLEAGYGLQNRLWAKPKLFPQCNYYDSVEVPESDYPNLAIAEEVDLLIANKKYQIIEIVPAMVCQEV